MTSTPQRDSASLTEFRMPSLGADMDFGKLVAWLVAPGDRVQRGQIIAEVETQKGVFALDVPFDGVVEQLVVSKGTRARVGEVLARILGEAPPAVRPPVVPSESAPSVPPLPPATLPPTTSPAEKHRPRASPLARRVAAERGVDLATVQGSGVDGAITRADVERVAGPPAPQPGSMPERPAAAPAPTLPEGAAASSAAMRQAVATAVARSKREIPHYYLATDVDMSQALTWLAEANRTRPVTNRILPAALLLKAVALALRRYPDLNGFWLDGAPRRSETVHLGVVISLRTGGLIAPAIRDADRLPLPDLMQALHDLVRRTREGGVRASEMTDATISVSNLGEDGVDMLYGVIYPPQVALVGFGAIRERAWSEGGMVGPRPIVTVTLAADHRATDGHYGARFLGEVARLLRSPASL